MSLICPACGRKAGGPEIRFCPYCGARLAEAGKAPDSGRPGEPGRPDPGEAWVQKALKKSSLPERKKILTEGLKACPDSRGIVWELLFIGEPMKKPPKGRLDYSIIKSWVLQIYREPGLFSEEERTAMRRELFDSEALERAAARFPDPEEKKRAYLRRLCEEYIEIFLEEDRRLTGGIFGFRREKNREKSLAAPAAAMIRRMRADEELTADQRNSLADTFYEAFSTRMGGRVDHLDEVLKEED